MQEKQIKKLIKKSKKITSDKIQFDESVVIDVSLNEFLDLKGEIYYNTDTEEFYLMSDKWYRYSSNNENKKLLNIERDIKILKESVKELINFCHNLKNYIDNEINKLNKNK